jgi:diguanylate cyclase (GGDEF)-like protein
MAATKIAEKKRVGIMRNLSLQNVMKSLGKADESERLRLAVLGAGEAVFDWTLGDDRMTWEGLEGMLPSLPDLTQLQTGDGFRLMLNGPARAALFRAIEEAAPEDPDFTIEFETSRLGASDWFELRAVRLAGASGRTERVVGILRLITEQKRKFLHLSHLATRDELTGHLNRTRLREELTRAISSAVENERPCAYVVAAIDKLAVINEIYGFDVADEVIVATGQRLATSLRSTDVIGRTAGNKFGVILGQCGEQELESVSERLRAAVRGEVIETCSGPVSATVSIGAVWLPQTANTSQEAMLHAEAALDRAKSMGRNGFYLYTRSEYRESERRKLMSIGDELMEALKDHRLVFAYQPIVDVHSRKAEHYECLLRLARKDGSIVPAGEFIPAAETLGLVRLLDRRVLEMAVAQLYAHPEIRLAINVSGTTAGDPSWLQSFINYVRENREVAERITVELTETAALHAFEENARFVSRLRDMGCRVAIDDFGAGYTSFRNLHNMRVDMVKIDGSYVRDLSRNPDNQLFVRTLVELAKNFQLETVAEWVGTDEDARLLEGFGVDYFQGYHFGMPDLAPEWMAGPALANQAVAKKA